MPALDYSKGREKRTNCKNKINRHFLAKPAITTNTFDHILPYRMAGRNLECQSLYH
jgi:hypothetical protein